MTPPSGALAIVPARNEEGSVGITVRSLRSLQNVDRVVVVADGCVDRTADEALAAGAVVLVTPRPLGKGGAVERVLDRLRPTGPVVLVDADVRETAAGVAGLLAPVMDRSLEVAIGTLPAQDGGGFGVVKRLAGAAIRRLSGFDPAEPLSGQRALSAEAVSACRPFAAGFGLETAMTIDAARLGLRIGEIEVPMTHRPTGRSLSGFVHRGRQGLHILRALIPRALRLR